jgi:excisionase family DNA binding protein
MNSTNGIIDAFREAIERAVESALRKTLNISDASNRRLLTVEETAQYLSLSEREIHNMLANHELPGVRRGRRVMIDIRDVDSWIEVNKGVVK